MSNFALDNYDTDRICAAIRYTDARTPALPEYDYLAAGQAVLAATSTWLAADTDARIIEVEKKFERPLTVGDRTIVISGVKDLVLERDGTRVIIDWKTRLAGSLDAAWEARLRKSWRGRLYRLEDPHATAVEYRGITADGQTRAFRYSLDDTDSPWVLAQLKGVASEMHALADFPVWPLHRPGGCGAYARTCPFDRVCETRANVAAGPTPLVERLSHSDIETFLLCPERYRLSELTAASTEDDRSSLDYGLAVHRGLAAVYEQLAEKQRATPTVWAR